MWAVSQGSCWEALPYLLSKQANLNSKKLWISNIREEKGSQVKYEQRIMALNWRQQLRWILLSTKTEWMNSKYPKPPSYVFISSASPLLPSLQVLKDAGAVPSLEQWRDKATCIACVQTHTHTGNIQPCFQHLLSKAPGVIFLKKTWGWNPILLLALCRLEPPSCHCDCHYCSQMAGQLMSAILWGPQCSPPTLSDRGAIYLSASTSAPSLPNPCFCQRPRAPAENTYRYIPPKSIT